MPNNLVSNHLYDPDRLLLEKLAHTLPRPQAEAIQTLLERLDQQRDSAIKFAKEFLAERKETAKLVEATEHWIDAFDKWIEDDDNSATDLIEPSNCFYKIAKDYDPPEVMFYDESDVADRILGND